jgi:hypothetical protein
MFLTWLILLVALCLSAVAAFYSIVGLAAIFAAAVMPIVIMGTILEVAKLVVTVWLHEYWNQCRFMMKAYLVPAVAVLMLITSMGIFGFLSKAHLDQTVPTGDVAAQVALLDERIKTERDNIETARRALAQMDAQVDQRLSRSDDERGAERAVQIRRQQARERQQLQSEIAAAQKRIAALNQERAPVASELRKVEAEVGPIKYIAAVIYGDNPEADLLEKSVRWVIIVLVAVFDPLAVIMLLAFTESYQWEKQRRKPPQEPQPKTAQVLEPTAEFDISQHAYLRKPWKWFRSEAPPVTSAPSAPLELPQDDHLEIDDEHDPRVKEAMKLWKRHNPTRTLKGERQKHKQGLIDHLPWLDLVASLPREPSVSFGNQFPQDAVKGDTWINTAVVPNVIYKYNGTKWITVDKDISDSYTYDTAYIDHLISELESGRYSSELLNDSELQAIEQRLDSRQTQQ